MHKLISICVCISIISKPLLDKYLWNTQRNSAVATHRIVKVAKDIVLQGGKGWKFDTCSVNVWSTHTCRKCDVFIKSAGRRNNERTEDRWEW